MLKLFVSILTLTLYASSKLPDMDGTVYQMIRKYNKVHKKFSKQLCSHGEDSKYYRLLKRYRGTGHYLPLIKDDIDKAAIQMHLPMLEDKVSVIKEKIRLLSKQNSLPDYELLTKDLRVQMKALLNLKKSYSQALTPLRKSEVLKESKELLMKFRTQFKKVVRQIYFLQSYGFPNDHLANRRDYEKYKDSEELKDMLIANRVFFKRKILEDGTFDPARSRSDLYFRSTLDTLYLAILKEDGLISENVRYDFYWLLNRLKFHLAQSKKSHIRRLTEWRSRTKNKLDFYSDIIQSKNKAKAQKLVKEKNESAIALKDFVLKNQEETYRFWTRQKPLMRSLYVMETILFNEVGRVEGKRIFERNDVAQIVINRLDDPFYSTLDPKQKLALQLGDDSKGYPWLNVLFKVGEFSFTYYYISTVVKIFCPDGSRVGRKLRQENLKISIKAMKHPRSKFSATRYFSRVSMLGKIDMSSVWENHRPINERAGDRLEGQRVLLKQYLADKYQFFYSFTDPSGRNFEVIEIRDEVYCVTWRKGKPIFYQYRDPHLFKYFEPT